MALLQNQSNGIDLSHLKMSKRLQFKLCVYSFKSLTSRNCKYLTGMRGLAARRNLLSDP